jgi:membrane protease YdiL (CAAX protease family)
VANGLLFGLAHFEVAQFAGLAVFGVVLGVLAWRTSRLMPGIGAHAAFNLVAVLSVIHLR